MQVSAIHTYPVKGCRRLDHDTAVVEPWGLMGDRRWLITDPAGVAITQRDVATLALLRAGYTPDGGLALSSPGHGSFLVPPLAPDPSAKGSVWGTEVSATPADQAANDWLAQVLGIEARLIWLDDPTRRAVDPEFAEPGDRVSFADGYPLLLANLASLDQLNDWLPEGEPRLPITRFRANVIIEGAKPFAEDDWTGTSIHIGDITFRVAEPCPRCIVTTTDQETGIRGKEPLRTLAKYRNVDQALLFGTNLIPVTAGTIRVGDEVRPTPSRLTLHV